MIRPYTTTTIVVVGCCLLAPLFVSCTTFALSTSISGGVNTAPEEFSRYSCLSTSSVSVDLPAVSLLGTFLVTSSYDELVLILALSPAVRTSLTLGGATNAPQHQDTLRARPPQYQWTYGMLGRILALSSSLPIVGVYQHFPTLSER